MMGEMIYSMKLKSKPRSRHNMIPTPAVQVTAIMAAMIMKAVTTVITMTGATMIRRLKTRFISAEPEPLSYNRRGRLSAIRPAYGHLILKQKDGTDMITNWLEEPITGFELTTLPCRCYKPVKGKRKCRLTKYCERVVFDCWVGDYWPRAVFWYQRAVMQNEPFAVQEMKRIEEFKSTERKAREGDADAQYLLSVYYFYSYGTCEDYSEGSRWMRKAVINGSREARQSFHKYFADGTANPEDTDFLPPLILPKGFRYLNMRARHGMKKCIHGSKHCVFAPWDQLSKLDFNETKKLACKGDPEKQYQLAWLYDHGHGVKPDIKKAIKWFVISACNRYAPAQTELGIMYHHGIEAITASLEIFGNGAEPQKNT